MDAKENLEHIASFDMESKETWAQDWETDNPEFHTNEVNAMLKNIMTKLRVEEKISESWCLFVESPWT